MLRITIEFIGNDNPGPEGDGYEQDTASREHRLSWEQNINTMKGPTFSTLRERFRFLSNTVEDVMENGIPKI